MVLIVQVCLIVELLCSYPLQLAPVLSMTEDAFLKPDLKYYEVRCLQYFPVSFNVTIGHISFGIAHWCHITRVFFLFHRSISSSGAR